MGRERSTEPVARASQNPQPEPASNTGKTAEQAESAAKGVGESTLAAAYSQSKVEMVVQQREMLSL